MKRPILTVASTPVEGREADAPIVPPMCARDHDVTSSYAYASSSRSRFAFAFASRSRQRVRVVVVRVCACSLHSWYIR